MEVESSVAENSLRETFKCERFIPDRVETFVFDASLQLVLSVWQQENFNKRITAPAQIFHGKVDGLLDDQSEHSIDVVVTEVEVDGPAGRVKVDKRKL